MNTLNRRALIVCTLAIKEAGESDQFSPADFDLKVAVDGGAQWFRERDITPDLAVGDFDSATTETLAWLESTQVEIQRVSSDKTYSDLELALTLCEEQQIQSATILGALGGRVDHQLCVLGALLRSSVPELTLQGAGQTIRLLRAGDSLSLKATPEGSPHADNVHPLSNLHSNNNSHSDNSPCAGDTGASKTFSVISLQGATVSITGARWPLDQVTLEPLSSLGLSNECNDPAIVSTEDLSTAQPAAASLEMTGGADTAKIINNTKTTECNDTLTADTTITLSAGSAFVIASDLTYTMRHGV